MQRMMSPSTLSVSTPSMMSPLLTIESRQYCLSTARTSSVRQKNENVSNAMA